MRDLPGELTSRGQSKRDRILICAAEELISAGYSGTTLAAIAKRAHTKAGSLYHYFDGREDLITAILVRGAAETLDHARRAIQTLPEDATSHARLHAVLHAHVNYVLSDNAIARASLRILNQVPPEVQARVVGLHREYGALLAALIDAAQCDGFIAADVDPRVLRLLIAGAVNWATAWFNPSGPATPTQIADLLVRLIFDGAGPVDHPRQAHEAVSAPGGS